MEKSKNDALEKLEELRSRLYLEGKENHNPRRLIIASELLEIQKMFLESEKEKTAQYQKNLDQSYVVTSGNYEDLDRGFNGGQLGIK